MSVVANVAINVDARGAAQKLQDFQRKSQAASKAADGLATATQKAGATAAKSANQFGGASRSINSLIGTLGKLAAAYAGVRVAQAAIQAGIGRVESERRIQFLARSYGEVEQLAGAAAASAAKFGESQTTANQALANAYARLRPVGVSLGDIVSTYNGFNTAARISGASSVEASNAFTQLAQALGSGALRGDEFNSIAEQVPAILTAISKETGVAQGALRDYAADGKITADVVIRALKRIETEGANQLEEALNGPQQKIKDFQNASEDLAVAFSRELIPQMTDAVKALASALRALEPILVGLGRVAAQVFNYIAGLANRIVDLSSGGRRAQAEIQASAEAQRVTREMFGLRVLSPEARAFREQYERNILFNFDAQERERKRAAAALPTAGAMPTGALPPSGTTGGGRGRSGGVDKAAREAERLAQEIERSLQAGRELGTQFQRQIMLMDAATETEKERLQIQFDFEDRAKQISELKNAEQRTNLNQLNAEIQRLELIDLQTEALKKQAEEAKKLFDEAFAATEFGVAGAGTLRSGIGDAIGELKEQLNPVIVATESIVGGANAIGAAFGQAFQDVATGAKSTQEALADAFNDIGKAFIGMAAEIIAKQMTLIILQSIFNALSGGTTLSNAGNNLTGTGALATSIPGFALGGARANGGPVSSNTPYIVGERGPELFVPGISGSIISTEATRAALADSLSNVLDSQAEDITDTGYATAATRASLRETERLRENRMQIMNQQSASERRYERERIEQMASTPGNLNIKYESQVINNVEYVTREQAERMAAQSAIRGRELALSSLQNSVKARKRVGMA